MVALFLLSKSRWVDLCTGDPSVVTLLENAEAVFCTVLGFLSAFRAAAAATPVEERR